MLDREIEKAGSLCTNPISCVHSKVLLQRLKMSCVLRKAAEAEWCSAMEQLPALWCLLLFAGLALGDLSW